MNYNNIGITIKKKIFLSVNCIIVNNHRIVSIFLSVIDQPIDDL